MIPINPMASPLKAPSTAPIWIATEVPTPCEEAPSASPFAIRLSMPNTFITNGPTMLPNIPTATTITAVKEGMQPDFSAMPIAIGVDRLRFERGDQRGICSHQLTDRYNADNPHNRTDKDGRQD